MRLRHITLVVLLISSIGTCEAFAQGAARAEQRLKELKITLPSPPAPVANYVPTVRVGNAKPLPTLRSTG